MTEIPRTSPAVAKKSGDTGSNFANPRARNTRAKVQKKVPATAFRQRIKRTIRKRNAAKKARRAGCVREMWVRAGTSTKECPR